MRFCVNDLFFVDMCSGKNCFSEGIVYGVDEETDGVL